jgi:hypothetical protein
MRLFRPALFRNLLYGCFLFDKHMLFKLEILPAKEKKKWEAYDQNHFCTFGVVFVIHRSLWGSLYVD